ncbi:MAG TPA: zinc metalloprotease, partial [Phaeodactylibacter sp.]|nr:zinc metalloprotease [Phaeodactylibacter sp.]
MQYLEQQILNNPKQALKMQQVENATREFLSQGDARVVDGIITIPVVVHVVWNTAAENISDEQIQSQITILTEDFRRLNSDANNNWPQAADAEIEFCLAGSDPNGNTTNGITRTQTSVTSFSTNDNVKFDATGGKDAWPSSQYLNFWVCDLGGGLLGYAQFPGGPANTDGIVCDYQYVGNIGTATPPYHLGRTATHEVGHWLNLRHIWGDGGCGVDDLVADTPVSDAPNFSCPTGHVSCGSTDMIENYMDYTHDDCMNLLTLGQ